LALSAMTVASRFFAASIAFSFSGSAGSAKSSPSQTSTEAPKLLMSVP
jgi:hypothetical protein